MLTPLILSGGSGLRLWPLSRRLYPKQFHNIVHNGTLFQKTIARIPSNTSPPIIVCNEEHRFIVAMQLKEVGIKEKSILLEPEGRNTAPAITIGCLQAMEEDKDAIMLVMSSDHVINDPSNFAKAINIAEKEAKEGYIVTLGVRPTKPSIGYGYIEIDEVSHSKNIAYKVKKFVEKPNLDLANDFIKSPNFLWNSGIFIFSAKTFIDEIKMFNKTIYEKCYSSFQKKTTDIDFIRLDANEFSKAPNISIDYALMEHTLKAKVVILESDWSDVGTWDSVYEILNKDKDGNYFFGNVISEKVENTLCYSDTKLTALIGINNLIVVDTKDALLISEKNKENELKKIVADLRKKTTKQVDQHTTVFRPWGYFVSLAEDQFYHAKKIVLYPNSRLSLQKHSYRSEHWVVLKGQATVYRNDEIINLNENESTFIPQGMKHRLENNSDQNLEIIEIQTGSYFGEDDIMRFEDDYNRG